MDTFYIILILAGTALLFSLIVRRGFMAMEQLEM